MRAFFHESVLANEVAQFFADKKGKILIDATAGGGGHLKILAEIVGEHGKVFAFDKDLSAHQADASLGVLASYGQRIKLFHSPFSEIKNTLLTLGIHNIDGILADLGVSSFQVDEASRGFSFMNDGPIDMRMDTSSGLSAYDWLKESSEKEIADTIFTLGGERKSRRIAKAIKDSWPIENSTKALAALICSAMRQKNYSRIHPATRSFQAIRMAVNHEIDELKTLLNDLADLLAPDGIAVIISFHSLEDRMVKERFKYLSQTADFKLLTKKPIIAGEEELAKNRRSRSAKLRVIQRLS
jgi:16S rRNA (cytosine1402-N4)-methyltransferase